jgi:PAS domain S-box-containing protein
MEFTTVSSLSELLTEDMLLAQADASVEDVLALMQQSRSSYCVIHEDRQLRGIFTERDWTKLLISGRQGLEQLAIAQVMTTDVITLQKEKKLLLTDAFKKFQTHHIRHIPIVDQHNRVQGIITLDHIRRQLRLSNLLKLRTVAEVVRTNVFCVTPATSVTEAIAQMVQRRISCVVVIDDQNRPIGVLTERDLVKIRHQVLTRAEIPIGEVMTTPIIQIPQTASLLEAQEMMNRHHIRRLIVSQTNGQLLGLITQSCLVEVLHPWELGHLIKALKQTLAHKHHLLANVQEELANRDALYHNLIANFPNGAIWVFNPQQRYILVDGMALEIMGLSHRAMEGKTPLEVFPKSLGDRLQAEYQRVLNGETLSSELTLGDRLYSTQLAPLYQNGNLLGGISILQDITEQRQIATTLQSKQAILDSFYESGMLAMGIVTYTAQPQCLRIISYNQTLASLFHLTPQQIEQQTLNAILPDRPFLEQWYKHLETSLATQQTTKFESYSIHLERWFAITISPLLSHLSNTAQFSLMAEDITQIKTAEQAIQDRERVLWQVLDLVPHLIFAKNIKGEFILANKATAKSYGVQVTDLINRVEKDFCAIPAEGEIFHQTDLEVIRVGRSVSLSETKFTDHSGAIRLLDIHKIPFRPAGSTEKAVLGIAMDVTQQKETERELQNNEATLRVLYHLTADPHLTFAERVEGMLQLGNSRFQAEIGILSRIKPPEEYLVEKFCGIVPNLQEGTVFNLQQTFCEQTIQRDEVCVFEHAKESEWANHPAYEMTGIESYIGCRIMVQGELYGTLNFSSFQQRATPFRDVDKELLQLMAQWISSTLEQQRSTAQIQAQLRHNQLLRDMTNRIRTTLDSRTILQTTAELIGVAFQVSRCVIHRCSEVDGEIQVPFIVAYGADGSGTSQGDLALADRGLFECLLAQDRAIAFDDVNKVDLSAPLLAGYRRHDIHSVLAIRTSSQDQANGLICLYQMGQPRQWQADEIQLLEDIAIQVGIALEQAYLLEARTQASQYLGWQNQELLKARREADAANQAQLDYLYTIQNGGENLLTIINDILDFSKIEAGQLELEYCPFDLRACLDDALDLVHLRAKQNQLQLNYVIDPDLPAVLMGDRPRLQQILVNLLSNAVKFTAQGGVYLWVTGDRRHGSDNEIELLFTVVDTGIGIPQDRINRLFKAFSQVDSSTTRRYGGTGLGLVICQRLCHMMGGQIWVESKADTPNQTFYGGDVHPQRAQFKPLPRFADLDAKTAFCFTIKTAIAPTQPSTQLRSVPYWIYTQTALQAQNLKTLIEAQGRSPHVFNNPTELQEALATTTEQPTVILTFTDNLHWAIANIPHHITTVCITEAPYISQTLPENITIFPLPLRSANLLQKLSTLKPSSPKQIITNHPAPIDRHTINNLNILIAEDNPTNYKVLRLMLKKLGYIADIAVNGKEVLDRIEHQTYDVILMDIQMPELDGISTTQCIRKNAAQMNQPWIIALTANVSREDREKCLRVGMQDYLSKPVKLNELQTAFNNYSIKAKTNLN